ncbi:MAG: DUF711 family protein [Metallosphaera sp.]|uniref:DUF711 family protein n=1 Tax=Metallosphaera sp. TaxID=2020860 RepID=UPI003161980F
MKVRSLTAVAKEISRPSIEDISSKLTSLDIDTFSKRLTLPPPVGIGLDKLVDYLQEPNLLYSIGALMSDDPRISQIPSLLSSSDKLFAHVMLRKEDDIPRVVKIIGELEPEQATRFAVLLNHETLLTPYYPTSSGDGIRSGILMSLIYVEEVMRGQITESLMKAKEIGESIEKRTGLKFLGVDPSVSPWNEESVGYLIESRLGKELYSPGVLSIIFDLNRAILKSSIEAGIDPIGFSEVMLPVAEDDVLKKRAIEGKLTLSHLINMSSACAAGLDMVGIVYDKEYFIKIMKDLLVLHTLKRRPYGVRIIPSYGEDKMYTKNFGIIPVVKTI